jgi:hypothetical protein
MNDDPEHRPSRHLYVYRGTLPPLGGLLLLVPLLLAFFSLVIALLLGGAVAAFVLPVLLRRRLGGSQRPTDAIELGPHQYRRVDGRASHRSTDLRDG